MTQHLFSLKLSFHILLQSTNEDRSDCKARQSDIDEIGIKHLASSAKRKSLDTVVLTKRGESGQSCHPSLIQVASNVFGSRSRVIFSLPVANLTIDTAGPSSAPRSLQ